MAFMSLASAKIEATLLLKNISVVEILTNFLEFQHGETVSHKSQEGASH